MACMSNFPQQKKKAIGIINGRKELFAPGLGLGVWAREITMVAVTINCGCSWVSEPDYAI